MLIATWKRTCWALAFELASGAAWAQSHHMHSAGGGMGMLVAGPHHHGGGGLGALAAAGGGYAYCGFPLYSSIGPGGIPFLYVPPLLTMPMLGPLVAPPFAFGPAQGVAGPLPPPQLFQQPLPMAGEPGKTRKPDPPRSSQLVTYGDRLFRAGNLHRAAERYAQALSADPNSAAPRVRLAQVALVRGHYAEAANRYREALIAEPGWLIHAPDIQSIYGEPTDFARQITKLETHLQAQPNDRDAWFVLGAQWYLSGKTRKAADIFLRLTDRKPDAALTAFLDASTPRQPRPQ